MVTFHLPHVLCHRRSVDSSKVDLCEQLSQARSVGRVVVDGEVSPGPLPKKGAVSVDDLVMAMQDNLVVCDEVKLFLGED